MRKLLVFLGTVVLTAMFASCGVLDNDKVAFMVGQSASGANQAGRASAYRMELMEKEFSTKALLYDTGSITNDGYVSNWLIIGDTKIITVFWTNTFVDNWATEKGKFYIETKSSNDGTLSTYIVTMDSEASEKFYSNSVVLAMTDEADFLNNLILADELWAYSSISITASEDEETYAFSGNLGTSKSDPFKYKESTDGKFELNGPVVFSVTTPDIDGSIEVMIDFDEYSNCKLATLEAQYPTGTVSGYVKHGNEQVDYTITYDGDATATLEVGRATYIINLDTGTYVEQV